jgi:hypothetical protein
MQLYDINDLSGTTSATELLAFANESWPTSGNALYIKGRQDSNCASIKNTFGLQNEFGFCNRLLPSICQFIDASCKI